MPSAREIAELKARREWEAQYNAEQREGGDKREYQRYLQTFRDAGRAGKAWDIEPLPFEQWRALMPADEPDPTLRGTQASSKHLLNQKAVAERDIIAGSRPLEDAELQQLGFDIGFRIDSGLQLSVTQIRACFEQLQKRVPEFDRELHFDAVADFLKRNRLEPTLLNASRTFVLLLGMGIIQRKPKPEPEPVNPELNEHGVNLAVSPSPEWERKQRQKAYFSEPVVTDPRTGETFTQYQVDRMDSETYRRLMFGEHKIPRITDVIHR